MRKSSFWISLLTVALLTGCGGTPAANPVDTGKEEAAAESIFSEEEQTEDLYAKWEEFIDQLEFREFIDDEISPDVLEYVIYDLDQDDVPELLIQAGQDVPFFSTWLFAFDENDIVLVNSDYGYGQYRYSPKAALVIGSSSFKPFEGAGESLFYQYADLSFDQKFAIINDMDQWIYVEDDEQTTIDEDTKDTYFDDVIMFDWKPIEASGAGGENTASEDWKEAYINYVYENGYVTDSFGAVIDTYKLVDINHDSIPELYVSYGTTADGDVLCTYQNGELVELNMWIGGFSYIEGENLFCVRGGHMDVYFDLIYTIEDGHFALLYEGEFGAVDNANVQFDSDGRPIYTYKWNGEELATEEQYEELKQEVFDSQRAVSPFDGTDYNSETGRYEGNGLCDYEEIIDQIQAFTLTM